MVLGRQAYERMAEEKRAEQETWAARGDGSQGTAFALNHHVHHVSKVCLMPLPSCQRSTLVESSLIACYE